MRCCMSEPRGSTRRRRSRWSKAGSMKSTPNPLPVMTERRILGRPASPGYAAGHVVFLRLSDAPKRRSSGDPGIEATALREAVAGALADTRSLQARVDAEAAEIVAFQVAMLEDDELVAPAGVAIAGG